MSALRILPLQASDQAQWLPLARGYKDFYRAPTSDEGYAAAWARLMAGGDIGGQGAWLEGRLVGIAHHLFHASLWAPRVCYLQDLFVDPACRGRGVARALIAAVADAARAGGASRFYWLTQVDNATARALYDRVARHAGFIRYDHCAF